MIESISLCMVTYNEGHRIFDTLCSVAPHVDEFVIVDQQSTDNTIREIENFAEGTNKVVKIHYDIHHGFCEPSRKKAHQHSVGEWVLVLDADECISDDFVEEIRTIDGKKFGEKEHWYKGCRLKRSLWLSGEHRFTGDYQYRFFNRDSVRYVDEIHTEPQPTVHKDRIYSRQYIGIWHRKTWAEQVRDEESYERTLNEQKKTGYRRKLELNVHLPLLRELGITAEEADAMTIEERNERGIGAGGA